MKEDKLAEERVMNEVLQQLQSEQPKIDQSMKNFLSVMMGKYSSLTIDTKMRNIDINSSSPSQNTTEGTTVFTKSAMRVDHFNSKNLFAFAKLLLQVLQETPLPPLSEFSVHSPQEEKESGMDYLNRVIQYKGIYYLRQKMVEDKQKISKVFGKSYFLQTTIWPAIKLQILTKVKEWNPAQCDLSSEEVEYLLSIYEKSFAAPSSWIAERKEDLRQRQWEEEDLVHYYELIWSKNFQETLKQYQQRRQQQVESRQKEKKEEEEEEREDGDDGKYDSILNKEGK